MTRQDIQILFEFDRWANNRILLAATVLTAEEFVRDLGGSFSSVRDVLVHIIGGEWIWISYWKHPPATPDSLAELLRRRDVLFNTDTLTNLAMVQSAWAEVEREQIDFVDHITDELLQQALPFRGTQVQLAHLMQHVANHSSYHRGQVALMMRQLHTTPVATDFHEFLVARLHEGTPKSGGSQ